MPLSRYCLLLLLLFSSEVLAAGTDVPACEAFTPSESINELIQQAWIQADKGEFDSAITRLLTAAEHEKLPTAKASLLMFAGSLYRASGQLAQAEGHLARAMEAAEPSSVLRHQILAEHANLLLDREQYPAVVELYEKAAVCDGPFIKPSFELGLAKLYLQDYDGVKGITRQATHYLDAVLPALPLILDAPLEEERRWAVLAMHAHCFDQEREACVQSWWRVLQLVNSGPKSEWARASLGDHVQRLTAWPEGEEVLSRARASQLLDAEGKLVLGKLPIAPQTDFEVQSYRIPVLPRSVASGESWGWAVVHLFVDHEGRVDDTEVIFAHPAAKGFERPSERAAKTARLRLLKPVAEGETVRVLVAIVYSPGGAAVWPAR